MGSVGCFGQIENIKRQSLVSHEAIVVRSKETVLLIPFEFAFRGLLVSHAILLCTACIDINEVSVGIILVGMTIVHILTL